MATFIADLEGVELTKEQHAAISSGVQEVVLRALAGVDTRGDLAVGRNLNDLSEKYGFPPHTRGIWIREAGNLFR